MSKRLVILGGGGHAKVITDMAEKIGYTDILFLDDGPAKNVLDYPVAGKIEDAETFHDGNTVFVIAIGDNHIRRQIAEKYEKLPWTTLIHPSAQIDFRTEIGEGTVVMANAVVNSCAKIGKHCIINTSSVVEHDNVIGDYGHISPRVALGGAVTIGAWSHICIGAAVCNNLTICENCIVGAGATVVKDLLESGVYVGIPAKRIR